MLVFVLSKIQLNFSRLPQRIKLSKKFFGDKLFDNYLWVIWQFQANKKREKKKSELVKEEKGNELLSPKFLTTFQLKIQIKLPWKSLVRTYTHQMHLMALRYNEEVLRCRQACQKTHFVRVQLHSKQPKMKLLLQSSLFKNKMKWT